MRGLQFRIAFRLYSWRCRSRPTSNVAEAVSRLLRTVIQWTASAVSTAQRSCASSNGVALVGAPLAQLSVVRYGYCPSSSAGRCPGDGPSVTIRSGSSPRRSSKPRASPGASTGPPVGPMSEPRGDAVAATSTSNTTNPRRTPGSTRSQYIGNASSTGKRNPAATTRMNTYTPSLLRPHATASGIPRQKSTSRPPAPA